MSANIFWYTRSENHTLTTLMASLHLFGGEKGGVGKSLVCRCAVQYHVDHKIDFKVFETDRSNPDVRRIYGNSINCEVGIFSEGEKHEDAANSIFNAATEKRILVNLPAQVFIPVKNWFEQNDLLTIAPEVGVDFYIWFVSDGGFDSLNLLRKSLEYFKGGATHIVVKNMGKSEDWEAFEQDKPLQKLLKQYKAPVIEFPKFVGSVVRNTVDAESLSFSNALEYQGFGVIEKQRVRKFLRESYEAFEKVGVF